MLILGPLTALSTEGSARFEIDGRSLFVIWRDDHLHAYYNRCPHLGVELDWVPNRFLDHKGESIQCATHGALFRIDNGLCIAGPCRGESLQPLRCAVTDGQMVLLDWPSA